VYCETRKTKNNPIFVLYLTALPEVPVSEGVS